MRKLTLIFTFVLILSLFGGLLASCSSNEPAQPTTPSTPTPQPVKTTILKFASAATADYIPDEEAYVNAVNARIGPAYKIEYYPAGQMLAFVEIMDGVRTGGANRSTDCARYGPSV